LATEAISDFLNLASGLLTFYLLIHRTNSNDIPEAAAKYFRVNVAWQNENVT